MHESIEVSQAKPAEIEPIALPEIVENAAPRFLVGSRCGSRLPALPDAIEKSAHAQAPVRQKSRHAEGRRWRVTK